MVVDNNPLCYNGYGHAFVYITGLTPPYSLQLLGNSSTYTSYSDLGVPSELPININALGVAQFEGLPEGDYPIEVSAVVNDIVVVYPDTITITLPPEIEVITNVEPDFLLTSSITIGEPVFYQWLFNGMFIEGSTSDVHYPQEVGNYQVYVEDVYGCSDYSQEVLLTQIGLQEFNEHSFMIYPNPAHTSISLNLNQLNSNTLLSFTDVLGQELHKVVLDSKFSNVEQSIDISGWPNGLYFLNLENNSNQIVKPFVKY